MMALFASVEVLYIVHNVWNQLPMEHSCIISRKKEKWEVSRYNNYHSCMQSIVGQNHRRLDSKVITQAISKLVKGDPSIGIKVLQGSIENHFCYKALYRKMYLPERERERERERRSTGTVAPPRSCAASLRRRSSRWPPYGSPPTKPLLPPNNPPDQRSTPPTSVYAINFTESPPSPTIVSDISFFSELRLCKSTSNEDQLKRDRDYGSEHFGLDSTTRTSHLRLRQQLHSASFTSDLRSDIVFSTQFRRRLQAPSFVAELS
ncbi:hypothetical protein PIB30_071056 [Stylosanthes scabra]|uniref:Uncharacterized protein n=1 Tax=Stylosanthes scabra TaxID=79078 RepID=A0ABU6YL91_9FABA|nr:hypothetical protein [Stylosanthes scabra]